MHPPLRSVNRETRVGDTRRPTGMKRGDPSVHLPQHAAHSLIRTNKLYGLTVIIVGFSITRTLSKSSHSTVNADVTCATIYWARWLAAVYVSATRGQCCPLVRLAAETSPRACSSKNRKSADFWFQLGVGGAHRFPIHQCFVVWPRKRDIFFFNCENKSQFTWNSLDRSFWTQTSPAPHPHYSRCSPLKMSKLADNFKKRRHISRYVFFFFSLGPLSASGRFHILHRKACSDAAAWPFLLLLGESRSLIVSQGL